MISAALAAQRLQSELRRMGAAPQTIGTVTSALKALTGAMKSGKLSAVEYTRAMGRFKIAMAGAGDKLRGLKHEANKSRNSVSKFKNGLREMTSASILAIGPLSGVGARIAAMDAIASRSGFKLAALIISITGVSVAMFLLIRSSARAALEMEALTARFNVAFKSAGLAAEEFEFVSEVANRMGIDILGAGREYASFVVASKAAGLSTEKTRKIFEGVAAASSAMRLTAEQTTGAFRAFQQMMSKGTVQAEELRGQLAERIPGAFQMAAQAMEVTTEELGKMLKAGKVLAVDLLPKLADLMIDAFGDEAQRAAKQLQGTINNLANAWLLLRVEVNKMFGISGAITGALEGITGALKFMKENLRAVVVSVGMLAGALTGALLAPAIFRGFVLLKTAILAIAAAIRAVNFAALLTPGLNLIAILGRIAGAAVGASLAYGFLSDSVENTSASYEGFNTELDRTIAKLRLEGEAHRELAEIQLASAKAAREAYLININTIVARLDELRKIIQAPTAIFPDMDIGQLSRGEAEDAARRITEEIKKLSMAFGDAGERIKILEDLLKSLATKTNEAFVKANKAPRMWTKALQDSFKELAQEEKKAKKEAEDWIRIWKVVFKESDEGIKATRRATEEVKKALSELGKAFSDEMAQFALEWKEVWDVVFKESNESIKEMRESLKGWKQEILTASDVFGVFADEISRGIVEGETFNEVLESIVKTLTQMALRMAIWNSLNRIAFGAPGAPGGGSQAVTGAGKMAHGGNFGVGQAIIVGEEGPELLIPGRSGTIIPNGQYGGMTINIDARGAAPGVEANIMRAIQEMGIASVSKAVQLVASERARGNRLV